MQEAFVPLNQIPTKIVTWGRWIDDPKPDKPTDIVIFIPGNPGITNFYKTFLQTVHEKASWPVWMIGHTGHEASPKEQPHIPKLKGNEKLYGLQAQVDYKVTKSPDSI